MGKLNFKKSFISPFDKKKCKGGKKLFQKSFDFPLGKKKCKKREKATFSFISLLGKKRKEGVEQKVLLLLFLI